ncbi:MAG: FAD-dependent thymidylate synthase [Clostridiales bacterium]|nr:FAD-dependent thymidylate synthase [Clostridiales bacterium]
MKQAKALIVNENMKGRDVVAAGARISTQEGNALGILARSGDTEKDLKLIRRVASSGHLSVMEHHVFNIAFNDVSVMVEQFVIESRLASFTVKSRRYVDFTEAGFVVPEDLSEPVLAEYRRAMTAAFQCYEALQSAGIPREDARFVLPYCLRSNFIVTVNLRELMHMIEAMLMGRGRHSPELTSLGRQLYDQVDSLYPGLMQSLLGGANDGSVRRDAISPARGEAVKARVTLTGAPVDPSGTLCDAMRFTGRLPEGDIPALLRDRRPRELELLHFTWRIDGISLACLTHFTRHRMVSALIPDVREAVRRADYVLPPSVEASPEAKQVYCAAFADMTDALKNCLAHGMDEACAAYFAQSGLVTSIVFDMNAREFMHFAALRTCARAQWEIREVAMDMLGAVEPLYPALFDRFGPSCALLGRCPEGRMSCGQPVDGYHMLMEKRGK